MKKLVVYAILLILILQLVSAPPSTKTVRGTVYKADGITQASSGILVLINDTVLGTKTSTRTSGPPTQSGRYSATLTSDVGNLIRVLSYNATNWGINSGVMGTSQVVIDIKLNETRASEAMVKILFPRNHSLIDSLTEFNVTANITILGADGTNCNATLIFSNYSVFPLTTSGYTLNLGNRQRGVPLLVKWNFTARDGVTNITVISECASDGINLEHLDIYKVKNVTGRDIIPPIVKAKLPYNNTRINNPIRFYYNVTDVSEIYNCSLFQNAVPSNETLNPQKNITNNFTYYSQGGSINWYITCVDNTILKNSGTAGIYNLSVNFFPSLTPLNLQNPINLIAGSNKTVYCNGTATDSDSYLDILNINSTLYLQGISKEDPVNRSNHYYNSSCTLFNGAGTDIEYLCSFDIEYYANNGTWYCNSTVIDKINATNSSLQSTDINELLAIGVSPSVIDFGALQVMQISPDDVIINVTNFGNVPLDLRLSAYSFFENDNISMDCTKKNITLDYERWSLLNSQFFDSMLSVNNSLTPAQVDINLRQKGFGDSTDSTDQVYFKLQIPFGVSGKCNGKILFSAVNG